jgi:hypothetical protein
VITLADDFSTNSWTSLKTGGGDFGNPFSAEERGEKDVVIIVSELLQHYEQGTDKTIRRTSRLKDGAQQKLNSRVVVSKSGSPPTLS